MLWSEKGICSSVLTRVKSHVTVVSVCPRHDMAKTADTIELRFLYVRQSYELSSKMRKIGQAVDRCGSCRWVGYDGPKFQNGIGNLAHRLLIACNEQSMYQISEVKLERFAARWTLEGDPYVFQKLLFTEKQFL